MTELIVGLGEGSFGFVERRFCRICYRRPLTVVLDFDRCWCSRSTVRPGKVVKKPASVTKIQVDGTGMKAALSRYITISRGF